MTKFAKFLSVAVVLLSLAACATAPAQSESVVNGDKTFSSAQTK